VLLVAGPSRQRSGSDDSHHQGEEVWGVKGMEKLWSAANVKIYGGGVDDDKFLRRISDLIGPYEQIVTSESSGEAPASGPAPCRKRPS